MIGIDGVSGGRVNTRETQGPEKKTFLGRQVDAGTGQEPKAQEESSRPSAVDRAKSIFSFEVDHTSSINAGFDKSLGHEDRYQAVFSVVKDKYASGSEKMRAFKAMSEMGMDNECPKDLKEKIVHTLITASQEDRGNLLLARMAFRCAQDTDASGAAEKNLFGVCGKKGVDPQNIPELKRQPSVVVNNSGVQGR